MSDKILYYENPEKQIIISSSECSNRDVEYKPGEITNIKYYNAATTFTSMTSAVFGILAVIILCVIISTPQDRGVGLLLGACMLISSGLCLFMVRSSRNTIYIFVNGQKICFYIGEDKEIFEKTLSALREATGK